MNLAFFNMNINVFYAQRHLYHNHNEGKVSRNADIVRLWWEEAAFLFIKTVLYT